MSIHIGAKDHEIAETVLMPGDPLRAQYIAETFLEHPAQYNRVRGMLGFTGTYRGRRVSVQGSGMGQPSLSIYVNELFSSYNVKRIIRVGSCGALREEVKVRDLVIAMSACTNSAMNRRRFRGMDYAPTASFPLLLSAWQAAQAKGLPVKVGPILASDSFYDDDEDAWKLWAAFGVLAVEMESAELYTLAAKFGREALTILTVSDSLVTGELTTALERERTFAEMAELALEIA
jgi:purine-nucleoside phosphorylase